MKKDVPFQPSGDISRVQSLGGGRWVRVFDHHSKGHHFAADDPALADLVAHVDSQHPVTAARIRTELAARGIVLPPTDA